MDDKMNNIINISVNKEENKDINNIFKFIYYNNNVKMVSSHHHSIMDIPCIQIDDNISKHNNNTKIPTPILEHRKLYGISCENKISPSNKISPIAPNKISPSNAISIKPAIVEIKYKL